MIPWLVATVAVAAVLAALGVPVGSLLPLAVVLACPLLMVAMTGALAGKPAGPLDHRGHGCEHDPHRRTYRRTDPFPHTDTRSPAR
jgi:hypothetical protein